MSASEVSTPRRVALLALLALFLATGPASALAAGGTFAAPAIDGGTAAADALAAQSDTLVRTTHLSLTPDERGSVGAVVRFDVPGRVEGIRIRLPDAASVVETDGFRRRDDGSYGWTGTDDPSLTLSYRVNRTASGRHASATDGSLAFADAGPWAITPIPRFGLEVSSYGDVELTRRTVVDGEGAVGTAMAYLGPYESYERAGDQRFRLVVPAAADLVESPDAIFDALTAASASLRVGDRDPSVLFIAAPAGVGWTARGLEYGDADAWVVADARLDDPDDVWLHEYVHTRQGFETTAQTRWLLEGTAQYYAALLTLRAGRIDFRAFHDYLERGVRYDAVLADPSTWRRGADYEKGALVAGTVDRRIRAATNGSTRLAGALARLNARSDPVTGKAFLDAVAAAAPAVRDPARKYTVTDATPEAWGYRTHQRVFGLDAARMRYALGAEFDYRASGRYRNATAAGPPVTLVAGETLTLSPTVRNVGNDAGPFEAALAVDGTAVANETGTLEPGVATAVNLSHTFEHAGTYAVRVGQRSLSVTVRRPARAAVVSVVAPDRVGPNETATVTATVRNDADRPGRANMTFRADGHAVASRTVYLPPGGERSVSATVAFATAGRHTVVAGRETARVDVGDGSTGPSVPDVPAPDVPGVPGFDAAAALAALALTAGLLARGRA